MIAVYNASAMANYVGPALLFVLFVIYIIFLKAVVQRALGVGPAVCCVWFAVIMTLVYLIALSSIWHLSDESENLIQHMNKSVANSPNEKDLWQRLILRGSPPIKYHFGAAGYFDKSLYFFLWALITDFTMNVLLM